MSSTKNSKAKKIAKTGVRSVARLMTLILKIIGTLILITVTTSLIFACIFAVYIKTNLSANLDLNLPDFNLDESSIIYYEDKNTGEFKELVTLQSTEDRRWVDYEDIPKIMEQALVAIEDKRFYDHDGVDWYRTVGAFSNMFLSMRDTFGGSTITQQLIKNLTNEDEVTVQRKLLEIFRALQFEKKYSKEEIIEWYLNEVTFGSNKLGIGAAANYYFGKDVSELTLAEITSIIGITNNPSLYNPYINKDSNKARQEDILDAMFDQGYIGADELTQAKNETLVFQKGEADVGNTITYSWYVDAVIEDVISDLMEQNDYSRNVAQDMLLRKGYRIYCSIDMEIQAKVDSIYEDLTAIPKVTGSSQKIESGIVITDPYTGDIVALSGGIGEKVGNRIFSHATMSTRPPGSSIKPLSVYAPAMEYGLITPETRFEDSADVKLTGTDWMTKNDDLKYSGVVTIRTALRRSINTVAAQILDKLTPSRSFTFLTELLGFTTLSPDDESYAPLALGQFTYGVTVREMSSAYTMFVNNGVVTESRTYSKLCDSDGAVVIDNTPTQTVAINRVTAYWITNMLQEAAKSGTGYEANLGSLTPVAGKTGTSGDAKDRWFAGYTPYYVAVVWTGFDIPATMKVTGNPSAQLWKKVMTLVHEDLPYKEFDTPSDTYLSPIPGVDAEVPYVVRGVTVDGQVLYEITDNTAIPGRDVTETATIIDTYEIVGSAEKTITITNDQATNVIEFYYQLIYVEPSIDPSVTPTDDQPPDESPTESPAT